MKASRAMLFGLLLLASGSTAAWDSPTSELQMCLAPSLVGGPSDIAWRVNCIWQALVSA